MALSFATQPQPPVIGSVTSTKTTPPTLVPLSQLQRSMSIDPTTGVKQFTETTLGSAPGATPPKSPTPVTPLTSPDPSTLVSDTDTVINRNPAQLSRPAFTYNRMNGIRTLRKL